MKTTGNFFTNYDSVKWLAECKFNTTYYDYEKGEKGASFECKEEALCTGLCIFHDDKYLQDKNNFSDRKQQVTKKLMDKATHSIGLDKALFCIGYHLPDIKINKDFTKPAYFLGCRFQGRADFSYATFSREVTFSKATFCGKANFSYATFSGETSDFTGATFSKEANFSRAKFSGEGAYFNPAYFNPAYFNPTTFSELADFTGATFSKEAIFSRETSDFSEATFSGQAYFSSATFSGQADFSSVFNAKTFFNNVLFEDGKKILFNTEDLSKVSFANTDITRVRFIETARWGEGKKDKDRFKVIEERNLEELPENVKSLGSIMAVYRNLRENYEFRLRYDEAGKFFIKEMELKRKYREVLSEDGSRIIVKPNCWFRRNLSLTGLYYHLSRYGENLLRPTLIGIAIIFGSTLFWLMQSNPYAEPSLSHVTGFTQVVANHTQWQKAFERSFADFLPLLPLGSVEGFGRFARVGEGQVKPMAGLSIHCGLGIAVGIIVSLTNCSLSNCLCQS